MLEKPYYVQRAHLSIFVLEGFYEVGSLLAWWSKVACILFNPILDRFGNSGPG